MNQETNLWSLGDGEELEDILKSFNEGKKKFLVEADFVFDFNWSKGLVNMGYELYTNLIFEKIQDLIKTHGTKGFYDRYVTKNGYVLVEDETNTLVPNPDEYKKAESGFEDTNIGFGMFFVSLRYVVEKSRNNNQQEDARLNDVVRTSVAGYVDGVMSKK